MGRSKADIQYILFHVRNSETGETKLYQRYAEDFVAGTTSDYKMTTTVGVMTPSGQFMFTTGITTNEQLMEKLLDTQDLSVYTGTRQWSNTTEADKLQAMINRVNNLYSNSQAKEVFGEDKDSLNPFLNDSDNDDWAIDGPETPNLGDGLQDPDGWTQYIQVNIEKL